MSIKELLKNEIKIAMKSKDKVRLETIRSLVSEMQYAEIQSGKEDISDEDAAVLLKREAKKRVEEIEFAQKAGRPESAEKTTLELKVIESFLPSQLNEAQLEKIISEYKQTAAGVNLGGIMTYLREKYPNQFDGKIASAVAKKIVG